MQLFNKDWRKSKHLERRRQNNIFQAVVVSSSSYLFILPSIVTRQQNNANNKRRRHIGNSWTTSTREKYVSGDPVTLGQWKLSGNMFLSPGKPHSPNCVPKVRRSPCHSELTPRPTRGTSRHPICLPLFVCGSGMKCCVSTKCQCV